MARTKSIAAFLAMSLAACGSSGGSTAGGDGGTSSGQLTITIQNLTFSPANLTVPPGATVTVNNLDSSFTQHSVTSESARGQFTPGAVNGVSFDTGKFTGTATFTIPANAPVGTVVPYYCQVHLSAMANSGQITIGSASQADAGTAASSDAGGTGTQTPPPGY